MTTHVIEEELQEKFACCSWELSLILLQVQDSLFADTVTLQLKKVPPFSCHVGFQDSRAPQARPWCSPQRSTAYS